MKKYITTLFLCISFITPTQSFALFGAGDIVFDPGQTLTSVIEFARDTGVDIKTAYAEIEQYAYQVKDTLMSVQGVIDDAEKLMRLGKQINELIDANDIAGMARLAQDYSITLQELDLARWLAINWDDFSIAQFMKVIDLMTQGEAIGIYASEVDDLFANKYEGWEAYTQQTYNTTNFGEKYNEWSVINRDTVKAALKTIGLQAGEITNEQDLMNKLKAKSATAEGNMQILQVSNDMASVGVGQMQKMRELLMAQTQMQAAFYASEQDEKDLLNAQAQSANMRELVDGIVPVTDDATWNDTGFKIKVP